MGIWDIRLGRVCISTAVWLPVTMGVTSDPVLLLLLLYIKLTTYIPGSVLKNFTYSQEAVLADNWANISSNKICTRDCILCLERPLQYSYHTTTPYWTQVPKKLSIAEIIT